MFRRRYADVYQRRRALAGDRGHGRRHLRLAGRVDLHPEPALFHGHDDDAGAAERHRSTRGRWRSSAIRSPPTTSRPAGAIKPDSPAGRYLLEHQVSRGEFNSYGARRGNHEVMMRGTFANIRIRNRMLDNVEGGFTRYAPTGETMPIYDAAMRYKQDGTPLVVIAGKEYGTGSSRDWAAKGTVLLGVRAVIAESFERIHRSNLVGMGVLPLQFHDGENAASLGLDGDETSRSPASPTSSRGRTSTVKVTRADGEQLQLHRALPDRYLQRARIFPRRRHPPVRAAEARRAVSAGVAYLSLRPGADHAAAQARRRDPVQLQPVHQERLSRASIFRPDELADRGRVRQLCPRRFQPGLHRPAPLQPLRDRHALDAADRSAARAHGRQRPAARARQRSTASRCKHVDGRSWPA